MKIGERDHAYARLARLPPKMAASMAPRLGVKWPPPKRKKTAGISQKVRQKVYERDGWQCVKCGAEKNLTLDHKVPRAVGGSNRQKNLQTMCEGCNQAKGRKLRDA